MKARATMLECFVLSGSMPYTHSLHDPFKKWHWIFVNFLSNIIAKPWPNYCWVLPKKPRGKSGDAFYLPPQWSPSLCGFPHEASSQFLGLCLWWRESERALCRYLHCALRHMEASGCYFLVCWVWQDSVSGDPLSLQLREGSEHFSKEF